MKEIITMIEYCSFNDLLEIEKAVRKAKRKFPKQVQQKEKPSDPVIEFRLRCHRRCKDWLNENGHKCHAWDALQNKGLNGIIDKIKFFLSKSGKDITDESVLLSFVGMMQKLPEFYAKKVDFDLFDRRFNVIVSEIKASKNGKQQLAANGAVEQFSDRFKQAAQRIAERNSNK